MKHRFDAFQAGKDCLQKVPPTGLSMHLLSLMPSFQDSAGGFVGTK